MLAAMMTSVLDLNTALLLQLDLMAELSERQGRAVVR